MNGELCLVFPFRKGRVMSKYSRDLESLRQNDNDLMVQYEELLASSARQLALSFEKIAASQASNYAQQSVGSTSSAATK